MADTPRAVPRAYDLTLVDVETGITVTLGRLQIDLPVSFDRDLISGLRQAADQLEARQAAATPAESTEVVQQLALALRANVDGGNWTGWEQTARAALASGLVVPTAPLLELAAAWRAQSSRTWIESMGDDLRDTVNDLVSEGQR